MNGTISEKLNTLIPKINEGLNSYDNDAIETTNVSLNQFRDDLRETIQEHMSGLVQQLIVKLKRNDDLSPEDIQMIEKWVAGDAVYYTKIENNLLDWVAECKRLCNMILSHYAFEGVEDDDSKMFALGALLTDLKYTMDDVIRYDEAMNRVDRFKSSIGTGVITKETRRWLAELMEQQLSSPDF